jgi:hypothetical protein
MNLIALLNTMKAKGVQRVFFKKLAPNDNSKNQIYLGGDLSVLNVIPSGEFGETSSSSRKSGAGSKQIVKAGLDFTWLDETARVHSAPNTQLILYPQYPEVRLSGFLRGSTVNWGEWFDPYREGRAEGRVLILGVTAEATVVGHLATPASQVAADLPAVTTIGTFGALQELPLARDDLRSELMRELLRIHQIGWMKGQRLGRAGVRLPCDSPQCGGYTLEAELGIIPNGLAEPDFLGWEVKSFSVTNFSQASTQTITLMTPEPDGGFYKDKGPESFVRTFGYVDRMGRKDRMNFGGVHTYGVVQSLTGLRLELPGFDPTLGKIRDVEGGIALMRKGECAALWSFRKLIDHWKRKHDRAAYVPNQARMGPPREYRYSSEIQLGSGTDFIKLLLALYKGFVYYDPGIKLEGVSTSKPILKRRSQFRVKARNLAGLYDSFDRVSLTA